MSKTIFCVLLSTLVAGILSAPAPQAPTGYEYARPQYQAQYQPQYQSVDVQAKPSPYDFGYEVKDEFGSVQSRQESSDGSGAVKGTYGYTDPNGVFRQVDYIADELGFRVNVKTNEPGTSNQSPADVVMVAEEPPAGVFIQKVRIPSAPVVPYPTQVRPASAALVGVRPATTVVGVRPAVKVVSPVQHNIYTASSPVHQSVYTPSFAPVHHNLVSAHHNLVPVSTPVHVVHAAPSPVYVSSPHVVKTAPATTHAVYKAPVGAAVVRSYGPF